MGVATALFLLAVADGLDRAETPVKACGPFVEFTEFTSAEPDSRQFFSGNLGILSAGYAVRYLVVAWRTLNARPLTDGERGARAFAPVPADPAYYRGPQPEPLDPVQDWLKARRALGFGSVPVSYRQEALIEQPFSYFVNCNDAAFTTARATLEARRQALGADNPEFRSWTMAQDVVFANCERDSRKGPQIPDALPASASAAARADRSYQIAAALFYAGQFSAAERAFEAIGRDPQSPWRSWGRYLAARAILRQATVGDGASGANVAEFARARDAMAAIVADPSQKDLHESAEGLLRYIEVRMDPMRALSGIAERLATADPDGRHFDRSLEDFRQVLRHVRGDAGGRRPEAADPAAADLIEWCLTISRARDNAHALERWRATRADEWLLAAMVLAQPDEEGVPELLQAARAVERRSPAYTTITYHRARLLLLSGARDEARTVLDTALETPDLSRSAVNQFRSARIQTARTLHEFLRDAIRTPVANWIDSDVRFVVTDHPSQPDTFDRDAIDVINERLPLTVMQRIASSRLTPPHLRPQIANAVFTRAVLLGDPQRLRAVLPPTSVALPELKPALARLTSASDDAALMSEAWLLLLGAPGLRPFLPAGGFRDPQHLSSFDSLRDNWWCTFAPNQNELTPYVTQFWGRGGVRLSEAQQELYRSKGDLPPAAFLSAEDARAARNEWAQLQTLGPAATELERHAIAWADRHRDDPRAPHVLARAVRAGHFGCGDETTWPLSKKAFTMLHQRYPKSEWAAKTPYWYR